MKNILAVLFILFFGLISCKQKNWYPESINEMVPMKEFWRPITGFDSIQLLRIGDYDNGKIMVNFCYPNKWEFEKFRKDTVFIHDTIYLPYFAKGEIEVIYNDQKNL